MQLRQSPHKDAGHMPYRKATVDSEAAGFLQQFLQHDSCLHPCHPGADTEMNTVAEAQMLADVCAVYVEL